MRFARFSAAILLLAALSQIGSVAAQQQGTQTQQPATAAPQTPSPTPSPGAPPDQQPAQPTFRAGVSFVRVDVIVTDRRGVPAIDLTAADFDITEDGKAQKIEQFRLIRVDGNQRPGDEPLREIRTAYDQELEAARDDVRLFVIFLDDYHTRDISALSVKSPLTQFIEKQIGPKDLVAIMYPLTPLDAVMFTRNHGQISTAIQKFEGRKYKYEPRNRFEEQYFNYPTEQVEQIRNQVVVTALRGLSSRLGSLREGRKAILYVGEGLGGLLPPEMRNRNAQFPNPATTRPDSPYEEAVSFFSQTDLLLQVRDITDAANRNNAAIYTIDPRGLATSEFRIDETASGANDRRMLQQTQDTLRALAEDTDGRAIINRNDLGRGLAQVIQDSSAYYLIGYNSAAAPADGKFHEIRVRLKRADGRQVRARRGYLAPTLEDVKRAAAPPKVETSKPVQQALASMVRPGGANGYVRSWVGMSRGENGKTQVTFVWEPLPDMAGGRRDEPGRVSLIAATRSGDLVFRGKTPEAAVPAAASTPPAAGTARRVTFDASPGNMELRIAVESATGGVIDSEIRDITVPDFSSAPVSISSPRVFRARTVRDVQAVSQDAAAVPLVGREFSRAERVIIRLDAYGAGQPPVLTAALLNRDGRKMADIPVTAAAAGGTHQVEMPLASIPPGEYVIEISAKAGASEAKELVPLKVGS